MFSLTVILVIPYYIIKDGVKFMIYGYARCSTNESLQNINTQVRELKKLGAEKIFQEYASGTKRDREQLNLLLDLIKENDTLIAVEVSRISRSTKQLLEIIEFAKNKKIKLILGSFTLDFTKDEYDPVTMGMIQMMGVFSELERNMISSRVKMSLENAKAKGKILGRPKTQLKDIPNIFFKHYPLYKNGDIKLTEFARLCNMSRTTIYKYLKMIKM